MRRQVRSSRRFTPRSDTLNFVASVGHTRGWFAALAASSLLAGCLGIAAVDETDTKTNDSGTSGVDGGNWPDGQADGVSSGPPTEVHPNKKGSVPPNSGDGYIGMPASTCQGGVHEDGANCGGAASCVAVGRDPPCGSQSTYRAYFRFELSALAGAKPKSATLKLYLWTRNSATALVTLHQIEDFGSLEVSDWDSQEIQPFGKFLDVDTPIGEVTKDVTPSVLGAIDAGAPAVAFMLKYGDESQTVSSSYWYGIASAEDSQVPPVLALTY